MSRYLDPDEISTKLSPRVALISRWLGWDRGHLLDEEARLAIVAVRRGAPTERERRDAIYLLRWAAKELEDEAARLERKPGPESPTSPPPYVIERQP